MIAFDVVFPEPDRLNPGRRGRHLPQSRRGDPRQVARAAEQRPGSRRRHAATRASCWANPDCPKILAAARQDASSDGPRDAGRGPAAIHVQISRPAAQRAGLEKAAAGRGLFTIKPERDGIVRRVPMIMRAQGTDHALAQLRDVAGRRPASDTILIKTDKAGIKSIGVKGFEIPTDKQRPALGSLRPPRSLDLCFGGRRARQQRSARQDRRQAGADRHLGGRAERHQDHAGVAAMPGVEIHAQVLESALTGAVISQPNYGSALEFCRRAAVRPSGDRLRAAVRAGHAGRRRRAVCHDPDRNVLVLLCAAPAADRLHLSAAVDHGDLSDADLRQLRARAGAARQIRSAFAQYHVAGAGRAAGAIAGKARARRRGARDDHHVLRRARLHHDLGDPTSTIRKA